MEPEYRYQREGLLWVSVPRDREMILVYKPLPRRPDGRVPWRLIEHTLRGDEKASEDELRAAVDGWFASSRLDSLSLRPVSVEMMGDLAPWEATWEIQAPDDGPDEGYAPEPALGAVEDAPAEALSYTQDHVTFISHGHRISRRVHVQIAGSQVPQIEDILLVNRAHLSVDEFEAVVDHWIEVQAVRGGMLRPHAPVKRCP